MADALLFHELSRLHHGHIESDGQRRRGHDVLDFHTASFVCFVHQTRSPGAFRGVVTTRCTSVGPYASAMSTKASASHGFQRSNMTGTPSGPDIASANGTSPT